MSALPEAIGLADCNNFYASCEAVFRPTLRGRPTIVLSNNDGCVIARSPEAKRLGITMGVAVHTLRALIAREHVAVCSANFALYGDMSGRIMDVLARYTEHLDVYSIDEAFLDFSAVAPDEREQLATHIRATVYRWTGVRLSLGVARTKTLAKGANDAAKHLASGVLVLGSEDAEDEMLHGMDIEDVWGIASRRGTTLREHGIATALALKRADPAWVKRHLYLPVARTQMELRGIACLPMEPGAATATKQQIMCSRSFGRQIDSLAELRQTLATYTARAAEKARAQHTAATSLTIFITTNHFHEDQAQYSQSCGTMLPRATHDTCELLAAALHALERVYRAGYTYHKAGVILSGFVADDVQQETLFDAPPDPRHRKVMALMDTVNARYGRDTLRLLTSGLTRPWGMRQEHRSPRYTSRWSELAHAS